MLGNDPLTDDWLAPDEQDPPRIADHAYDCGPDEMTGGPCIAIVEIGGADTTGEYQDCGEPRAAHERTEYPTDGPHEPPSYDKDSLYFNDDSHDHLHPYVD